MGVGGRRHALAALPPPGKTRYLLYRRLVGAQGRSGWVRKISPPTGIWSPDRSSPVASRYTDWAVPAPAETCVIYGVSRDTSVGWSAPYHFATSRAVCASEHWDVSSASSHEEYQHFIITGIRYCLELLIHFPCCFSGFFFVTFG